MLGVRLLASRVQGQLGAPAAAAAAMGFPPAPSQPAEPLGLHQAASSASGGSEDVAERVLQEGLPHVPKYLKDPEDIARKALKEAARELERKEVALRDDHAIPKGGVAAAAQSAAAHRLHPEESQVAEVVHRRVAAEAGGGGADAAAEAVIEAAAARAARQLPEKRPHTVEEVLRAGASELEHRESLDGRPHQRHSLASQAQSAADRAAHGGHPALEQKVIKKLNEPGGGFCEG